MMDEEHYEGMEFQLDTSNGKYATLPRRTSHPSVKTLDYRRIDGLHFSPTFLIYIQHPVFRQITRRYIGNDVSVFRSMVMNKPAGRGTVLPWHQDIGEGWGLDQNPTVTVWTSLDASTIENGCMQIVPGSHKIGILNPSHYTSDEDIAKHVDEDNIVDLTAEAGEAILIHNWLLHRSGVNNTTGARRALSVAYIDASTRNTKTHDTFPVVFGQHAMRPVLD